MKWVGYSVLESSEVTSMRQSHQKKTCGVACSFSYGTHDLDVLRKFESTIIIHEIQAVCSFIFRQPGKENLSIWKNLRISSNMYLTI